MTGSTQVSLLGDAQIFHHGHLCWSASFNDGIRAQGATVQHGHVRLEVINLLFLKGKYSQAWFPKYDTCLMFSVNGHNVLWLPAISDFSSPFETRSTTVDQMWQGCDMTQFQGPQKSKRWLRAWKTTFFWRILDITTHWHLMLVNHLSAGKRFNTLATW